MKSQLLSISLLTFILIGCSSDNRDNDLPTTQEFLTSGIWTGLHNFEDTDLNGSFVEFGDDCEKDDQWNFQAGGTLIQGLGPTLCDPDDDPNEMITSNWRLEDNDQYLVIELPFDEIKFYI